MSLRIGFDASALSPGFKEHAARGIGRYVSELSRYFSAAADSQLKVENFDHQEVLRGSLISKLIDCLPGGRTTVRQQMLYPWRLGRGSVARFDLLHFPAHMDPPAWCPKPYAVTVLDLIPLVMKDLYRPAMPGWRFDLARWLELQAIKNAALILAISENTARDVEKILGIEPERILVTPLGVDESFFSAVVSSDEAAGLRQELQVAQDTPLILYVGGIDQRKNSGFMLEAFRMLLDERRARSRALPVLIMAGRIEQDRQYPGLIRNIEELGLGRQIRLTGYLPDAQLLKFYALSSVFFFPSLYEGFGLTPLEAMAAGVPLVCSNTSAMPEVVGDAALMISPMDRSGAARAMAEILDRPELAAKLREAGRLRARSFSWQRTGELTLAAYKELARRRGMQ